MVTKSGIHIDDTHLKMLKRLEESGVFKFKTCLNENNSELKFLFKEYSDAEIIEFIRKFYKKKFFISKDIFNPKKINDNNWIPIVINWERILKEGLLDINGKIATLIFKHPFSFKVMFEKAMYLMKLEYYGYKQPSVLINTLDNVLITYFTDHEKYKLYYETEKATIQDVFANLQIYLELIPMGNKGLYNLRIYEKFFSDFGVSLDKEMKDSLLKTSHTALVRAEKEWEDDAKMRVEEMLKRRYRIRHDKFVHKQYRNLPLLDGI